MGSNCCITEATKALMADKHSWAISVTWCNFNNYWYISSICHISNGSTICLPSDQAWHKHYLIWHAISHKWDQTVASQKQLRHCSPTDSHDDVCPGGFTDDSYSYCPVKDDLEDFDDHHAFPTIEDNTVPFNKQIIWMVYPQIVDPHEFSSVHSVRYDFSAKI